MVVVICFLGALPTIARTYLDHERMKIGEVFRVRALVLDPQGVPVSGATLRTTASNETTTDAQGTAEVAIYRATMPADGKVTIYADLNSAFLHGHRDITLDKDPNPSVRIELKADGSATVSGLVEDQARRAISGASVSVLAGETGQTGANGMFTLKTNAGVGQMVRLHVDKAGCGSVDQDHPAGRGPVTIMLNCRGRSSR